MIIHRLLRSFPIFTPVILASLCVASCGPRATKEIGVVKVMLQNAPESIDPRFALSAYATTVSELIYAPLVYIGEDLKAYPMLASEVQAINATTLRVKLRSGLFFHNKRPLTARDVVFTYSSIKDPKTNSPHREKFKYIKSIQLIDENTVEFVLEKTYAPFLTDLAGIGIVPAHGDPAFNGSGPFKLASWNRNTNQMLLLPHPLWFEGPVSLPKLKIIVVKDPTTRLLEILKGNADLYAGSMLPIQLEMLRKKNTNHLAISTPAGLGYSYLAMNLRGPKPGADPEVSRTKAALANPKVRMAMARAINIDEIIEYKFLGLAERATGLLPTGHWAKSSQKEIAYDLAQASELLDDAGFPDRGPANGGRFSLVISTTTDRFRQSIAQIIAESLKRVSIKTSIRIQDWGSLFEDIKQGNFEMFSAKWLPVIEPDLLHWVFHSQNIPGQDKGGGNRGAFKNVEVDTLLTLARETSSLAKRRLLYKEIENILSEELPYIPLWFENEIVIQSACLRGFIPSRTGSLFGLRLAKYERC